MLGWRMSGDMSDIPNRFVEVAGRLITIKQLADDLGVSHVSLYNVIRKRKKPEKFDDFKSTYLQRKAHGPTQAG